MRLPARVIAPLVALTTTLIVALSTLMASSTPAHADSDPMAGAPQAGQCYNVSGKTAWESATASNPIACTSKHTLWIYAVGQAPADADLSTQEGQHEAYEKVCTLAKVAKSIGKLDSRVGLSAYVWGFDFVPTKDQIASGSHWISCEVGIFAGNEKLYTTTWKAPKSVSGKLPKAAQACSTSDLYNTNCASKHAYHAKYAKVIKTSAKKIAQKAGEYCESKHIKTDWVYRALPIGTNKYVAVCSPKNKH